MNYLDDHDSIANADTDEKAQAHEIEKQLENDVLKRLSFVDRFLAVWIFLAMVIGITLGKTVPGIERKLERGTFVGTPIPIGMIYSYPFSNGIEGMGSTIVVVWMARLTSQWCYSCWLVGHDVSYIVSRQI